MNLKPLIIFALLLCSSSLVNAEENRARALSENQLSNMLMDLRMAKEDLQRSERLYDVPMFGYKQMNTDLNLMISNLEHFKIWVRLS